MSDIDDIWRVMRGLSEALGRAEDRIAALEQTVCEVHGEMIENVRNRVYALEHPVRDEP